MLLEIIFSLPNPRLFALIIGIDKYPHLRAVDQLQGAVADARNVSRFLEDDLKVPSNHIRRLENEDATRTSIIESLQGLMNDERIEKEDAILIYFAGHGAETVPPKDLPSGGEKNPRMQMLLTANASYSNKWDNKEVLEDYIFGRFIRKIAGKHGSNIVS